LQAACAALFDAKILPIPHNDKYEFASKKFIEQTEHHFSQLWKRLDDKTRTVLVIMVVLHFEGIVLGKEYSFGEIEKSKNFSIELEKLTRLGFVEKVGSKRSWQWDSENFLLWRDQRWRVSCEGVAWWLSAVVISGSSTIPNFAQWLRNQEVVGYLLTRKQWDTIKGWIMKAPEALGGSISSLLVEFFKGFLKKKD
jgi:hypothetical protein